MECTAKEAIKPRDGVATFRGRRFILVDAYYIQRRLQNPLRIWSLTHLVGMAPRAVRGGRGATALPGFAIASSDRARSSSSRRRRIGFGSDGDILSKPYGKRDA